MDQPESPKNTAEVRAQDNPPHSNLHNEAVHDLYVFAVTNFSRLDGDHDDYISKAELDKILKDGTFQGKDAERVKVLRDNADAIAALNHDGWFSGATGISPQGLLNMNYLWEKQQGNIGYAERIRNFGVNNFDKLDFDKRGQLFGYEIVAENGDGCYSPQKRSIIAGMSADDQNSFSLLYRNLANIGHSQPVPVWMCKPYQYTTQYGITKNELEQYPSAVARRPMYDLVNKLTDQLK